MDLRRQPSPRKPGAFPGRAILDGERDRPAGFHWAAD
jgi:hypothetical protein